MGVTADLDRIARVCLNNRTFQPVAGIFESASDQPICMIISTCLQLIMDLEYVRVEGTNVRENPRASISRFVSFTFLEDVPCVNNIVIKNVIVYNSSISCDFVYAKVD